MRILSVHTSLLKFIFELIMCIWAFVHVCAGAWGDGKMASEPLKLEL